MKPFLVAPDAADDLNDIWFYLAEEAGEVNADRMIRKFSQTFGTLAELPGMGRLRTDLTSLPLHFFLVDPYFVVYRQDRTPLEIYAVLHTARELEVVLRTRPQ